MTSITQALPLATLSHDEWLEPLVLERWCEECERTGVVSNPLWEQFDKEFDGVTFTSFYTRVDAEIKWWGEHGYPSTMLGNLPAVQPPPEEETCAECEGRGRLLTDEGRILIAFVQRWAQK